MWPLECLHCRLSRLVTDNPSLRRLSHERSGRGPQSLGIPRRLTLTAECRRRLIGEQTRVHRRAAPELYFVLQSRAFSGDGLAVDAPAVPLWRPRVTTIRSSLALSDNTVVLGSAPIPGSVRFTPPIVPRWLRRLPSTLPEDPTNSYLWPAFGSVPRRARDSLRRFGPADLGSLAASYRVNHVARCS